MAAKANAVGGERPHRQAGDLPSMRDETVCDELPPHLLKVPTGIVGTAIDADTHALTIDYDPLLITDCLLYTSPIPRDLSTSRMPSSA